MNVETIIQRFLLVLNWIIDNPGDASLLSIICLIARKVVISEITRVIQMGRDEELIWTRKRVEELTGDRWSGPQPILKRVKTQYFVNYYSYLLLGTSRVYLLRRERKSMVQTSINYSVLFLAIAGALKLILQPFGIDLAGITDQNVNDIANGFSALMVIIGIIRDNVMKLRNSKGVQDEPLIPAESNK